MTFTRRVGAASATLLLLAQVFTVEAVLAPSAAQAQPDAEARRGTPPQRPIQRGGDARECFDKGRLDFFDCPDVGIVTPVAPATPPLNPVFLTPRWTGFNIGGHLGFADAEITGVSSFLGAPVGLDAGEVGFVGGGQFGYNYQFRNNVVLGGEIDGSFASITVDAETPASAVGELEIDYTATARARLGYAMGRVLPFVTGGGGLISYEGAFSNGLGATASFDETAFAPVVGGGLNFMVTRRFVAGVEGHYFFVDEDESLGGLGGANDSVTLDDFFSVRFGFNYKF